MCAFMKEGFPLLVKAVRDVLGTATGVEIEHSLPGQSLLRAASPTAGAGCRSACQVEARMKEYVAADTPIVKHVCPREVAISIVKEQGLQDKVELFAIARLLISTFMNWMASMIISSGICRIPSAHWNGLR